ncbi:hypothetical protein CNEO4_330078 [Clostridium neonatale]|uniref:Uncharacterized protein n=1 Tax=Clostridium neonatale TaxID=137838 RepID=A0AA86JZ05_9CLOT|nr:hypothetical protein CNEO_44286 [Clostridium neonatale]CAI3621516.1 hypothetical protein CNEO3_270079 [Clostridium neonatale]CAI3633452.1 hypothetical protein CNEO4_330077 [Clostridium neonatale]CAI3639920.1 hypothetical protein CNEO4_330078 [Clostridium neonatale]CAI3657690.1 hypothetical protein CNEO4_350078 [Clostridium neonatale]
MIELFSNYIIEFENSSIVLFTPCNYFIKSNAMSTLKYY